MVRCLMTSSNCPYCNSINFSAGFERRPGQHVERCEQCLKYSVRLVRNGVRYPVSDPLDSSSMPQTNKTP